MDQAWLVDLKIEGNFNVVECFNGDSGKVEPCGLCWANDAIRIDVINDWLSKMLLRASRCCSCEIKAIEICVLPKGILVGLFPLKHSIGKGSNAQIAHIWKHLPAWF